MATKLDKQLAKVLKKARGLVKKGHLLQALEAFREASEFGPFDYEVLRERGEVAEHLGERLEAAECYFRIADMFARSNMFSESAAAVRKVLSLDPAHGNARALARYIQPMLPPGEPPVDDGIGALDDLEIEITPDGNVQPVVELEAMEPVPADLPASPFDESFEDVDFYEEGGVSDTTPGLHTPEEMGAAPPQLVPGGPSTVEVPAVEIDEHDSRRQVLAEAVPGHESTSRPLTPPPEPARPDIDIVEAVAETIAISPLLSELDSDMVKLLIEGSTLLHKKQKEVVFSEGDEGGSLYLILRGDVDVERRNLKDDSLQQVATLRPGAFFGEMALLTDGPRSATVRAATDLTLLDIPRETIRDIVERQSRVRKLLMRFFRARMVGSLMVSSELFQPFSVEDRRELVTRFRLRELPPGQAVLEQGSPSEGLYVVLAGAFEELAPGNDSVVGELGAGDIFGEVSLLDNVGAVSTVRAKSRGWILRLPKEDFDELVAPNSDVVGRLKSLAAARKTKHAASA